MKMETRWQGFEALSALLLHRRLSMDWTGPTSVSENVFTRTDRLLRIYALVCDHKIEIDSLTSSPTGAPIRADLLRLSERLASASESFNDYSREIRELAAGVRR